MIPLLIGAGKAMRKVRDYDAELKALGDKARTIKARKVQQLGELVMATGADALDLEVLAGILRQGIMEAKVDPLAAGAPRRVSGLEGCAETVHDPSTARSLPMTRNEMPRRALLQAAAALGIAGAAKAQPSP